MYLSIKWDSFSAEFPGLNEVVFVKTSSAERYPHVVIQQSKMQVLFGHFAEPFLFFFLFTAAPAACGSSQARGQIEGTAAGLHHSHSHARSEPRLLPTPQLSAMLDP